MAFADHLNASPRKGGTTPLVARHLEAMSPDEATDARALLVTGLSDRQVAEAFTAEGYSTSANAVATWRRHKPDGHTTRDLNFCSLACVWQRYPGDPVRHDG